jgi:hypothetical protein
MMPWGETPLVVAANMAILTVLFKYDGSIAAKHRKYPRRALPLPLFQTRFSVLGVAMDLWLALAALIGSCSYSGPLADVICKDSALAAQAQRRALAIDRWRAVDTRDMAILYRRDAFEEEHKADLLNWSARRKDAPKIDELRNTFSEEADAIEEEIKAAQSISPEVTSSSLFTNTCLANHLPDCTVREAGFLNNDDGKLRIMWQHVYRGGEGPASQGMMIAWDISGAKPAEIGHILVEGTISPPRLVDYGDTQLLHLPAHGEGTGWGNEDALFEHRASGWHNIDIEGWKREIPKRAPKGLSLWHGVDYEFDGMAVEVPLWRANDANCCNTGGAASVHFVIKEDRLAIDDWQYEAPARTPAKGKSR